MIVSFHIKQATYKKR